MTVAFLIAGTIAVSWAPRMSWGLWLDETYSAWQAEAGWAIGRDKLGDPGQSVLFGYVVAMFYLPGSPHMEAWLRIPALLGGLVSCFFGHRLAELLVGRGTGMLALLPMVGSAQMITSATQARPYTWAVASCLASLWALVRWLETGRRRHGLAFSISLALAVHMHLLFAAFAVVPAFLLHRRARRGQAIDWVRLMGWVGLAVLLVVPLVPRVLRLSAGPDMSARGLPGWTEALADLIPWTVTLSLVGLVFLQLPMRGAAFTILRRSLARAPLELAAFWYLAPPLILLVGSHLLERTLFLDRYYIHTVAAEALIVAVTFRRFPQVPRTLILAACFLTVPILYGLHTRGQLETAVSWRPPLQTIRNLDPAATAPVFMQSGHAASNASDWQHGVEHRSFLYSQLVAYPLANHVYPLPYELDDAMQAYVRQLADTELAGSPLIFVGGLAKHPPLVWIRQFFEARGYAATFVLQESFWVLALRRAAPRAPGPS